MILSANRDYFLKQR